jgi:hypothetical protein
MPEIDFDRLTLAQVMDRTARRFPEREAILSGIAV